MKYNELLSSQIGLQIKLSYENGMCYVVDINSIIYVVDEYKKQYTLSEVGDDYLVLSSPQGRICLPLDKVVFIRPL